MKFRSLISLFFVYVFVCVSFLTFQSAYGHVGLSDFDYLSNTHIEELKVLKKRKNYTLYQGSIVSHTPSPYEQSNGRSKFRYYKAKGNTPKPLLILFPTITGLSPLEGTIARRFAREGYHVLISTIDNDVFDPERTLDDLYASLVSTTISVRRLIDLAATWSEIDSNRIHGYGVSLGGIRAALALGVDLRIKSAAVYVAGGNFPEILAYSIQRKVKGFREGRMMRENISDVSRQYLPRLQQAMRADALDFSPRASGRRKREDLFMILGEADRKVPFKNQMDLYLAYDRPMAIRLPFAHRVSGAASGITVQPVMKFFENSVQKE